MPMTRSDFPKDLEPGLNTHFGMEYRQRAEEWRAVYEVNGSQKHAEEDVLMTGFAGAAIVEEGDSVGYASASQGWSARYQHDKVALAFAITEEAVDDNLYFSLGPKYARALARALRHTKEILHAGHLNNAFSSSYLIGDGKAFMSTAHPVTAGGTQSNTLATPADLSEEAVEDLLIQIRKAKDDMGVPMALMAKRSIIPPELEYEACRIFQSSLRPGTADNDVNAVRTKGIFTSDPHVMTYLTDPDAWFIQTDCPDGLKHFRRKAVKRGMEGDFETGNMRYKAWERYSSGVTDWRCLYGSEGAA